MFCELGGEFVDTYNEDIRKLGKELGVEMQNLTTEGGDELYFFKGVFHMPNDMIDPKKKTGAFVPIAKQIAKDAGKLTDKYDHWTAYARKLNALQNKIDMKQGFAHVARRQRRRSCWASMLRRRADAELRYGARSCGRSTVSTV